MCCCGKPTINGMPGAYSWDGKTYGTHDPNPPTPAVGEAVIYDESGRCGGLDAHSHHFQLVKGPFGYAILVRHGGGDERIPLGSNGKLMVPSLASLDTNARYWLFHTIYSTHRAAEDAAATERDAVWRKAAAEKRIKTRKLPSRGAIKVWIEAKAISA